MMRLLAAAAFGLLSSSALAQQVYPGCATPPTTFNHVWYIDPVNGKTVAAGGLGSAAAPWDSLQALFEPAPSPAGSYPYPLLTTTPYAKGAHGYVPGPLGGPVAPGDEVLLMNGNYGAISIGQYQTPINNGSGFVTIAAAPGQTPMIPSLTISASSGFVFSGIKFQSLVTEQFQPAIINISDQGASYPASNLVFYNVSVSAADAPAYSTWTQAQWNANAGTGFSAKGSNNGGNTTCVSVTKSHLYALHFGLWWGANNSLLAGNEIDHFGDDAVDYSASNITMDGNYIHDVLNFGVGAHPDAFQGYGGVPTPPATYYTFNNVEINNNVIIQQTGPLDPSLVMWLDGIDDYSYGTPAINNLTVCGNTIIVSSGTGILFGNITNSMICNDMLLPTAQVAQPPGGTAVGWPNIVIGAPTAGIVNANVQVVGNVMTGLNMVPADPTIVASNNIIMTGNPGSAIYWVVNGTGTWLGAPGVYSNGASVNNLVGKIASAGPPAIYAPCDVTCTINTYDPSTFTYDLRLLPTSPAAQQTPPFGAPVLLKGGALFVPWGQ